VPRAQILGSIKMRSFLSGMPELKLGLNDKALLEAQGRGGAAAKKGVEMEDIKFHQCVRLARFEADRTISFIPPDGEFELMSYRLSTQVKPLIWVETVIEAHGRSRVEYMVKAKSQFKNRSVANHVEILIPVPPDVDSPAFRVSTDPACVTRGRCCVLGYGCPALPLLGRYRQATAMPALLSAQRTRIHTHALSLARARTLATTCASTHDAAGERGHSDVRAGLGLHQVDDSPVLRRP
jgi:hypothetical protein